MGVLDSAPERTLLVLWLLIWEAFVVPIDGAAPLVALRTEIGVSSTKAPAGSAALGLEVTAPTEVKLEPETVSRSDEPSPLPATELEGFALDEFRSEPVTVSRADDVSPLLAAELEGAPLEVAISVPVVPTAF